jgi:DNA-binding GntR family transcriptional regulator
MTEVEASAPSQLRTDAYDWILSAITSFQFPVNAQLSENKLAKEIGISRTPVREALQRLEKEGLVRRGPNARFTVALLTPQEVDEACDVLALLDSYMFVRAAERISAARAGDLVACAESMLEAAQAGDLGAWGAFDGRFHEIALAAGDNPTAAEFARMTRRRIQRFSTRAMKAQNGRLIECSGEHVAVARAITQKRVEDIPALVHEHVDHMRHSVVESLAAFAVFLGNVS